MGPEYHRFIHEATGYLFREFSAHAGGRDLRDHAVLDMTDKRSMYVRETGCSQCQAFDAHFRDLVDYHVDDLVAAAEMMMERNRHSVLETALADRILKGDDLAAFLLQVPAECRYLLAGALVNLLTKLCSGLSYKLFICHSASSSGITPAATARAIILSALITTGRSTILPLTEITPLPL